MHATRSNQPPAATTSPLAQAPAPSSPAPAATTPDAIIDLSHAAALQIGMVKAGLVEVKVEVRAPAPQKKNR